MLSLLLPPSPSLSDEFNVPLQVSLFLNFFLFAFFLCLSISSLSVFLFLCFLTFFPSVRFFLNCLSFLLSICLLLTHHPLTGRKVFPTYGKAAKTKTKTTMTLSLTLNLNYHKKSPQDVRSFSPSKLNTALFERKIQSIQRCFLMVGRNLNYSQSQLRKSHFLATRSRLFFGLFS